MDDAPQQNESRSADAAKILVVDDSRVSAKKLALAMRKLGHEINTADDGAAALERLRECPVDIVLLDIVMPRMDGYAVLTELKADPSLRDIPVIVISSLDDEIGSVVRAIELGAEDFLPKNFEPAILRARLEACLSRKRFRDRELEYFRGVEQLTRAAQVIEAGAFRPQELALEKVAARPDPLGQLATVFGSLAQVIYERERRSDQTARTLRGVLLALIAGSIFGIAPALGRMAAGLGAQPLGLVVWANAVAAVICLGIAVARGGWPRLRWAHLGFFLIWSLVLGCLYQLLTVMTARHVEASMIALIGSSRAFMVFALAALISLEKPSLRRFVGLALGFAAVAAVLLLRDPSGDPVAPVWFAAALGIPFLLAVHTLIMSGRPRDLDSFATVGLMMALSATILAPVAHATGGLFLPALVPGQLEILILVLGAASGVAIALALDLVATAGAVFASQIAYSQTLAGIAWGMVLLDERLPLVAWAALTVVIFGFWLVQPKQAGEEFSIRVPVQRRGERIRVRSE